MTFNQSEICRATGLSKVTVSEILNNRQKNPKLETLERIAECLGCSIDELRNKIKEKQ